MELAKRNGYLLEVEELKVYFPIKKGLLTSKGYIKAVDGVNFSIKEGETLGLVGESGCGKTTVGRSILRFVEPISGTVKFMCEDITKISQQKLRLKRKDMQMVFQDPYASLNPRMTAGAIIGEPYTIHGMFTKKERIERVLELMRVVGLRLEDYNRFPHQFSGGQRQRIGIARALALNPKLIIFDEPVSALDVSIQAQILNLIKKLQKEYRLTFLFISHDLGVVKYVSDKIAVMYLGKIVELAPKEELFNNPKHPYTQCLLASLPIPDPKIIKDGFVISGDVPSPSAPPSGCRFHTRCPEARDECKEQEPFLKDIADRHYCSCHYI